MILNFNSEDLMALEKHKRAHFINSLGGFKSVSLVGTSDKEGNSNLAVFSSIFHIGANPPLIGLISFSILLKLTYPPSVKLFKNNFTDQTLCPLSSNSD